MGSSEGNTEKLSRKKRNVLENKETQRPYQTRPTKKSRKIKGFKKNGEDVALKPSAFQHSNVDRGKLNHPPKGPKMIILN